MLPKTVHEWLDDIGLVQMAGLFSEQQVEMSDLPQLTEPDLEKLGIPLGPRKRLMRAIDALQSSADVPSTRRASPGSPHHAERRQLTVVFCDLVGSTALAHSLDPETLRDLMRAYQQACVVVIDKFNGHVAQFLGGGLMVYFGWPRAHDPPGRRSRRRRSRDGLRLVGLALPIDARPRRLSLRRWR